MGLGLSLVVYDWFNDPFVDRDRNPAFGQPPPMPNDAVGIKTLEDGQ